MTRRAGSLSPHLVFALLINVQLSQALNVFTIYQKINLDRTNRFACMEISWCHFYIYKYMKKLHDFMSIFTHFEFFLFLCDFRYCRRENKAAKNILGYNTQEKEPFFFSKKYPDGLLDFYFTLCDAANLRAQTGSFSVEKSCSLFFSNPLKHAVEFLSIFQTKNSICGKSHGLSSRSSAKFSTG